MVSIFDLDIVAAKEEQVNELENEIWTVQNVNQERVYETMEVRDSVVSQCEGAQDEYEILKSVNVLNDCFYIWHDGLFGTINGLRMGRLPSVVVPWEEVNAGEFSRVQ